ncbi:MULTISPECIES: ABC transporter ATP-binding protein [Thalassospira]|uniref:ABC transporter ATP-binding protein n=2 Tax=Thalassospira TaxID=168934 RepID=A0A367W9S4_9PROT|nr:MULTISPECIES: sn-glycerol-3-phosphate ABC transporter ATP-binding protein UgpC [Thalassospira]MDG4719747.1 sn-glycerol-3-phosphate ABC transporter ATP-binding protein UgpC [Thalassospira sp. FZY0004]RCK38198.1 ABC transporter ATP-binding protein [Thalassospira profundimaris]
MAKLELKDVKKSYGPVEVIKGIDLTIEDGEFCVFVGPSGCGKSTLLRMIAGLEDITDGTFAIDGERMNDIAPAKRGIAMVFQSYALYPHLTVRENIAFGLKVRKTPKAEIDSLVNEAVTMLQLDKLTERFPRELSGGQRQRVAIGRAIVGQPETFLFDEPLSNLDAELRVHMRTQISDLHSRLKRTMIYVTHDQVEAMTLADKIVLLRGGKIEQIGSPRDLYERPQNLFAAQFIGTPKMNIFELNGDFSSLRDHLNLPADAHYCGIRPDSFEIVNDGDGILSATVRLVEYLGNACLVHAEIKGHDTIIIEQPVGTQVRAADRISLTTSPNAVHAFAKDGNRID